MLLRNSHRCLVLCVVGIRRLRARRFESVCWILNKSLIIDKLSWDFGNIRLTDESRREEKKNEWRTRREHQQKKNENKSNGRHESKVKRFVISWMCVCLGLWGHKRKHNDILPIQNRIVQDYGERERERESGIKKQRATHTHTPKRINNGANNTITLSIVWTKWKWTTQTKGWHGDGQKHHNERHPRHLAVHKVKWI